MNSINKVQTPEVYNNNYQWLHNMKSVIKHLVQSNIKLLEHNNIP